MNKKNAKNNKQLTLDMPLQHYIRHDTNFDLSDTITLADKLQFIGKFSKNLFIAVTLETIYGKVHKEGEVATLRDVCFFLVDPDWDSAEQLLLHFACHPVGFDQPDAALWLKSFVKSVSHLKAEHTASWVRRAHTHWCAAMDKSSSEVAKKPKPRRGIEVFSCEAVLNAQNLVAGLKDEKRSGAEATLDAALENDGFRVVANAKKAVVKLAEAKRSFENLKEPIDHLQSALTLAGCRKSKDFRVPPILLLGEPGVGKTFLAMRLANALGVPMVKLSAGGQQGGFQLTGSHSSWTGSRPGAIADLLAVSKVASPIVLIDELDKIRDTRYPVLPVLLDLLEPETAKCFKDEYFEMSFDASKIIFILTANTLDGMPESLLSRCEVFEVPRPGSVQRLRIIQELASRLRKDTGWQIEVDGRTSVMLADRVEVDLRKVTRIVEMAFSKAILHGEKVAFLWAPEPDNKTVEDAGEYLFASKIKSVPERMLH